MEMGERTFIRDVEELKEFIKTNQDREDYFDKIVEKVISKNQENKV